MVTPAATRRRATSTIGVQPSEDTTKSKVVFEPEGNDAMITEQIGAKTVTYQAKVKEDENANETDDTDDLGSFEDFESINIEPPAPQIPKSQLDLMFEDVNYAINVDGLYDTFFAKLMRQPDSISDKFTVPNRDIVELGVIQFNSTDRFNFIPAIQEANNNSGGRFSISIYGSDYKPLEVMRGRASIHAEPRPVGLVLVVPNPQPKPVNGQANGANTDAGLNAILTKIVEINQSNHNQLIQILNRKPEKSTLELAIEQKVLNDILNPPERNNNGNNDASQIVTNVMQSLAVTTALGDAISKSIYREPTPAPEPDWIDKMNKAAENPMVQQLLGRVGDIGEAIAVSKMKLNETTPIDGTQPQPNLNNTNQMEIQPDETQELILDIIHEVDSENLLDATNETIAELAADYPNQYQELVVICKSGASFEFIFDQLIKKTQNMQPSPFFNYLNVNETNAQQKLVWNQAGVRMKARLLELYEYLKTV